MPTALVTGASAGIGKSFAEQLARRGYDLVLVARRVDRLQSLADSLDVACSVEILPADLETELGISLVERRIADGAFVDLVVNNAGFASRGTVSGLDIGAFERMLRVNVLALARISSATMRRAGRDRRAQIINVASGTVFMQMPGNAGYGASKNMVMAFTRHMQVEAQDTRVHVQLLIPGVIATDFHAVAGADLSRFPPERVMQADDLVLASLQALETGEGVVIPSLPNARDWQLYVEAERSVAQNVSRDRVAERYL